MAVVILCHDIYETTYQAMERVIPDLIAQGYQIVTIGELFQLLRIPSPWAAALAQTLAAQSFSQP